LAWLERHKKCGQATDVAVANENVFLGRELVAYERVVKRSRARAHNHDADATKVKSSQRIHLLTTHTREVMVVARKGQHDHSCDRLHIQRPTGEGGKRAFDFIIAQQGIRRVTLVVESVNS